MLGPNFVAFRTMHDGKKSTPFATIEQKLSNNLSKKLARLGARDKVT
jgi:hypothetical protein